MRLLPVAELHADRFLAVESVVHRAALEDERHVRPFAALEHVRHPDDGVVLLLDRRAITLFTDTQKR